jgi:hypothetical protein
MHNPPVLRVPRRTARRPRVSNDQSAAKAEQFQLTFTQEQIDEISECGVSLQNLAELY